MFGFSKKERYEQEVVVLLHAMFADIGSGKRWRVGFYMSVLEEGEAGAGDSIERVEIGLGSVTVRKVNTLLFFDKRNIEGMKKALRIPALSPGWRESFARRLAKAGIAVNEIDLATTSMLRRNPRREG